MNVLVKSLLAVGVGMLSLHALAAPEAVVSPRVAGIVASRCALCHGPEGQSASAVYPRLAGQHPAYLEIQLKEFTKRERTNDNAVMHTVASKLTALETRAVAIYIGGLQ